MLKSSARAVWRKLSVDSSSWEQALTVDSSVIVGHGWTLGRARYGGPDPRTRSGVRPFLVNGDKVDISDSVCESVAYDGDDIRCELMFAQVASTRYIVRRGVEDLIAQMSNDSKGSRFIQ